MGWDWVGTSNFMCTGARYTFFTTTLTKYFGGVFFIGCVYCMYACMYIYIHGTGLQPHTSPRHGHGSPPRPWNGGVSCMDVCMHACM